MGFPCFYHRRAAVLSQIPDSHASPLALGPIELSLSAVRAEQMTFSREEAWLLCV